MRRYFEVFLLSSGLSPGGGVDSLWSVKCSHPLAASSIDVDTSYVCGNRGGKYREVRVAAQLAHADAKTGHAPDASDHDLIASIRNAPPLIEAAL